jgi:Xaa-Pro aminopeptidase
VTGTGATVHDHAGRRDRLRVRLRDAGVDLLLVTHPPNVTYLSGFRGSNGQVLVAVDGRDLLVTDARYDERAAAEAPGLSRALSRDPVGVALDHLPTVEVDDGDGPRLGVEETHLSWAAARDLQQRAGGRVEVAPTAGLVESLREIKDEAELALLRDACHLTVEALTWLADEVVRVGVRERDLAIVLERRFVDLGADGVAFPSIVASGPNGAVPHHAPGERRLAAGDLVTIDCGAEVGGYHADCTRTFAIGEPDDRLVEVYEVVARAQTAGRAAAVAGATSGEVDGAARGTVERAGFGAAFLHGTGHGVGLEVHEAPAVARGAAATLRPGTALTVEPGVYLPGIGGVRIEDTIVVTADGPPTVLTAAPRELRVLPATASPLRQSGA